MKTGNRRRRKLNRLAKARALRARCQLWRCAVGTWGSDTKRWPIEAWKMAMWADFDVRIEPGVNDAIMSTIDFSWSE